MSVLSVLAINWYCLSFKKIYISTKPETSVKRWINNIEDKNDKDGDATIFKGCLKRI